MADILPESLLCEILSRVPAKTLLRFRCVCQTWCHMIDDQTFAKLHLHRQKLKIANSSNGDDDVILKGELCTMLYSLSLESIDDSGGRIMVKAKPLSHKAYFNVCGVDLLTDSCNGIMLTSIRRKMGLWNPLTREYHKLPSLTVGVRGLAGLYHSVVGLGCDFGADDYKVLRISQVFDPRNTSLMSETLVYSVKMDCWRRSKDVPYRISRSRGGSFVNGALHWICKEAPFNASCDDLIIALDIMTEDYRILQLPSLLCGVKKPAMHLGVLNGCLIVSCYYQIERFDVWIMEGYGVESSWTKLFSIAKGDDIGAVEALRPVKYTKCRGQVLLQHNKKEFLWFDLKTRRTNKIWICGGPGSFSSQTCLPSLVLLSANG